MTSGCQTWQPTCHIFNDGALFETSIITNNRIANGADMN